ncbi:putative Plasmodesmata-located protein 2 [Hibiscus syriacus]|uniref:Plasmodesmata-located protein 2 n=1 Tax=Hibiscus syriacus TaxID=106335 RepID=A0A6A2WK98_HIBSY|nr:uncharacterized protein LOC120189813 [Hibiscus syriacus]KAE8659983.1 putative Plasmodesmata-located protein 2 [Hibiscus syriacus]
MDHSRVLEVTILSADDLFEVYKNMKTYAIVWVQPNRKLTTGIDPTGGSNPVWNDKFSFRVDDKFLSSDESKIVIEIYAAAWVKDSLVGCVNVNINDIFHLRSVTDDQPDSNSIARSVTLQIRRPSGRPQGIINMEVALVDSTMRSLPLLAQPKPKTTDNNSESHGYKFNVIPKMIRSLSDRTELKMQDNSVERPAKGSVINGGSMVNGGSDCGTDVGPSVSVVAAAIAKGVYKPPVHNKVQTTENPKISEWTRKEREQEELEMKIERWGSKMQLASAAGGGSRKSKRGRKRGKANTKLFSCFSNALGIEISITCGEPQSLGIGKNNNKVCHLSDADDSYSESIA